MKTSSPFMVKTKAMTLLQGLWGSSPFAVL